MNGVASASSTALAGLEDHGDDIEVKHCTFAVMTAVRAAAMAALLLYNNAKQTLRDKKGVFETARDAVRAFATIARDILKPILGSEYHEGWDGTGFVGSLAVSMKYEDLLPLMEALVAYFTAHPTLEVASRGVTAAQAQTLLDDMKNAFNAVTAQETSMDILFNDRNAKFDTLRGKLVMLVDELSLLIDPLDPRWKAFGFNMPGAKETPDAPTGLSVVLVGPTAAATKWEASARADYYRVWMKVHGTEGEPTAVGSPADLDFTLENLPANTQVDISVSAVNNGGESPLSEVITITTH